MYRIDWYTGNHTDSSSQLKWKCTCRAQSPRWKTGKSGMYRIVKRCIGLLGFVCEDSCQTIVNTDSLLRRRIIRMSRIDWNIGNHTDSSSQLKWLLSRSGSARAVHTHHVGKLVSMYGMYRIVRRCLWG
jgi:hypothetical protein